jgi:hypothetical protein
MSQRQRSGLDNISQRNHLLQSVYPLENSGLPRISADASPDAIKRMWLAWKEEESRRRLGWGILVGPRSDVITCAATYPTVSSDVRLDSRCSDRSSGPRGLERSSGIVALFRRFMGRSDGRDLVFESGVSPRRDLHALFGYPS